ncbi:MAG: ADP-ribosylglycohydrolase family protein [Steroidobacteraceae bacterium]
MRSPPSQPLPDSYWVLPGRLLAGEYPGSFEVGATRERIGSLLAAGVDCFVDLTAEQERTAYADLLPSQVEHHRRAIRDHSTPDAPEHMLAVLEVVERSLRAGRCVYVHCHAGIGRTGTVIGCLLVEHGLSGAEALAALNRVWQQSARARSWPSIPETAGQIEYVRGWVPRLPQPAGVPPPVLRSRFLGALVGLAAGDALAAATERRLPGTFTPVAAPIGGGPFELPAGAWSDDTAMALCLADSLLACGGFDARDQVQRYVRWQREGYLSATGCCVGISRGVAQALAAAQWRRQRFAGSHEPRQLDPEPLSRVAPAVMMSFASAEEAVRTAGDAARITCQAPAVIEACRLFAAMLHAALRGQSKDDVLAPPRGFAGLDASALRPRVRFLARAGYRGDVRGQLRTGSTVLQALEVALCAFDRTLDFEEGALLVANLGERSDVAAAAYGQLAGAHYGVEAIPADWRRGLARVEVIEDLAGRLYQAGVRPP